MASPVDVSQRAGIGRGFTTVKIVIPSAVEGPRSNTNSSAAGFLDCAALRSE